MWSGTTLRHRKKLRSSHSPRSFLSSNRDTSFAYVTNRSSQSVSVIETATNTVVATLGGIEDPNSFISPVGVAVTPDGASRM
jgi:YVTN family beta-propeller protein